ncbi:fimbrial biogenesis chaperone [Gracilimonas amylolytica]|uniref:hypothetical protein n=1 Tax=Gracilimonas amylolytica TaxID=1749045 RepID=UPI000CD9634F|nr:hypothetical protein [Gracilimonas amylolytica]
MTAIRNILLAIALVLPLQSMAQVTIAPTNLFIDSQSKFGTYMVINNSNTPQEVSIDFFFGYSQTDENGNRTTVEDSAEVAADHSIAESIRAFPRNFVLNPNQRQIVRLRITPPNTLNDGVYWSRIKTSSTPQSAPIELSNDQSVTAQVGIVINQVTGLFYKNGDVNTGIEVAEIRTEISDENILAVLTDYNRTGNAPFLGTISVNLKNSDGEVVQSGFISTSLYFDGTQRQELNIEGVPSGQYTIEVKFESQRNDVSSRDIVQMDPVTATTTVTIP